jgi:hypothetical protein
MLLANCRNLSLGCQDPSRGRLLEDNHDSFWELAARSGTNIVPYPLDGANVRLKTSEQQTSLVRVGMRKGLTGIVRGRYYDRGHTPELAKTGAKGRGILPLPGGPAIDKMRR